MKCGKLYQKTNENRKMVLKEKLSIKMVETETVTLYVTRITQVRDE